MGLSRSAQTPPFDDPYSQGKSPRMAVGVAVKHSLELSGKSLAVHLEDGQVINATFATGCAFRRTQPAQQLGFSACSPGLGHSPEHWLAAEQVAGDEN